MDGEVAAALLCESFLPFPRPLAGPLKRGPVAGPGSAAGRVVALLREGRTDGRSGSLRLVALSTAAPLKRRASSVRVPPAPGVPRRVLGRRRSRSPRGFGLYAYRQ